MFPVPFKFCSYHILPIEATLRHKRLFGCPPNIRFKCESTVPGSTSRMRQDAFSSDWKGQKAPAQDFGVDLPPNTRVLPFEPGGLLSFGVGVNLKMAATRWTNWAADIGLRNDRGSPEEGCVSSVLIFESRSKVSISIVLVYKLKGRSCHSA